MRTVPKKYDTKIICFDFDKTITLEDKYPEIGKDVNLEIKHLIFKLYEKGYKIVINSSRDTIYFPEIKNFLYINDVKYHEIHLKCKPTADIYIDDKGLFGDTRELELFIDSMFYDSIEDLCKAIGSDQMNNIFMNNIVNVPENPNVFNVPFTNTYRVIVPMTGGMDSTTLWKMADEAKIPYELYYIDMGQKYVDIELKTIKKILGYSPKILKIDIDFKQYKHILIGRNAIIILMLAEEMKKNGWWGDIWFGNLQGESPIIGGDKSQRFFHDISNFLVHHNYDVRVCNPLIGLDKFDEVSYWKERNIEVLKNTRSCFDTTEKECGICQSCFRKYIAFKFHGIDIRNQFEKFEVDSHVDKYERVLNEALKNNDFTHYSKERIVKTLAVMELMKQETTI